MSKIRATVKPQFNEVNQGLLFQRLSERVSPDRLVRNEVSDTQFRNSGFRFLYREWLLAGGVVGPWCAPAYNLQFETTAI